MKEIQYNIERLLDVNPVNKIEEYHKNAKMYHQILKDRKRKEEVYLLDKIEFSKFYVPPLLKQSFNYTHNDNQRYYLHSHYGIKTFYKYDGWKHIFDCNNFVYVIGGPGYGKSLFLTKLINDFEQLNFLNNEEYLIIYGDLKTFKYGDDGSMSMLEYLQNCMIKESIMDKKYITKEMIEYYIDLGRCLLLFDALDEVEESKRNALHERIVTYFENKCPNNKICITSRSRGFIPENNHVVYEILPLERQQIERYLDNLIKLDRFDDHDKSIFLEQANVLMKRKFLSSFLILSLLLHIFKAERNLPDTKLDLYSKCFEYISYSREKKKNQKYNWNDLYGLMIDNTFSMLANMGMPNNSDIDRRDIVDMICKNYVTQYGTYQATRLAADNFLNYCSERTELFVLSSEENKFHFFHRSFFEYFYANYVVYQLESIERIFDALKQLDLSSEVFELVFAMIKQKNKTKYQDLVRYVFEKCILETKQPDLVKISAFNILTLAMQVIDDVGFRNQYIDFLIKYKDYIINYHGKLLNDKIYEVICTNNKYIDKIVNAYTNEAKITILNALFLSIHNVNKNRKNGNKYFVMTVEEQVIYNFENYFYCNLFVLNRNIQNFFDLNMNYESFNDLLNNNCITTDSKKAYTQMYKQYNHFDDSLKEEIADAINDKLMWLKEKNK